MPEASFLGDAVIVPRGFTGDAWIVDSRLRHHRVRDHHGAEKDIYVVLSQDIGPYLEFTPVHYVLQDLLARLIALETSERVRGSFTGDAVISRLRFTGDAVILRLAQPGSFTGDSVVIKGGSFTGDAYVARTFTGDAFIV